nr:hypothetical protein [uncultured Campylobacter sp.]
MSCAPKKPRIWRERAVPCAYGMPQEMSGVLSTDALSTSGTGRAQVSARHGGRAIDRRHEGVFERTAALWIGRQRAIRGALWRQILNAICKQKIRQAPNASF